MGFLDKLLGKTKDVAHDIGEKAAPMAEKASSAVGGAVGKARDTVAEHADDVKGAVDRATDFVDDKTGGRITGALDKVDSVTGSAVDAVGGKPAATAAPDEPAAAPPSAESDAPAAEADAAPQ
jgi:ElaB/YqjD/DUF883 family membrane-anchored ribosome-binding protein